MSYKKGQKMGMEYRYPCFTIKANQLTKLISIIFMCFAGISSIFAATLPVPDNLSTMIEKVSPSVVDIKTSFFTYEKGKRVFIGEEASGAIIDAQNGYIVTNAHAIAGNDPQIRVELQDGRYFNASIVGQSGLVDLAVLKITANNLQAISLGSEQSIRIGQDVVVIGSALGLKESVTKGIISALQRGGIEDNAIENYIQTDAAINHGNSGGPLINLQGQMIGVNVSMYTPGEANAGIGFAIPIDIVKNVVSKLIKYGKADYSTLGFKVIDLQAGMSHQLHADVNRGAVIVRVIPGSPAALADLRMGDIITQMNDQAIKTAAQLQSDITLLEPNKSTQFTIVRQGAQLEKTIVTRDLSDFNKELVNQNQFLNDFSLENAYVYDPIWGVTQGVKITYLRPGSLAPYHGFAVGDIIVAINFQPVHSIEELQQCLQLITKEPENKAPRIFVSVLRHFDMLILEQQEEGSKSRSFITYI